MNRGFCSLFLEEFTNKIAQKVEEFDAEKQSLRKIIADLEDPDKFCLVCGKMERLNEFPFGKCSYPICPFFVCGWCCFIRVM